MRVLTGRAVALSHTFTDSDEETPVTKNGVTVDVLDATGTSVLDAPLDATSGANDLWTVTVPALSQGLYTAAWVAGDDTADYDRFEVVGRFLFTVPYVRETDSDLADTGRFPAALIQRHRETVEAEFERMALRSFTPRTAVVSLAGDGSTTLITPLLDLARVLAVKLDDVEQDASTWTVTPDGFVKAPAHIHRDQTVVLTVDYGFRTPPADVARIGVLRLRSLISAENSGIPSRATHLVSSEGGQFTLATPGMGKWVTGIPDVDATVLAYRFDVLGSVE